MSERQQRALMIAYYFPPLGGAGVQRTLKFARYLPEYGWQPQVLTVRHGVRGEPHDPSLGAEVPNVPISRTAFLDLSLLSRGAARLGLRRFAQLARLLLYLPDQQAGWLPWACAGAIRLARSADLVYSTSAPYTAHLVGLWLKLRLGRPWVADFRDEWSLNPFFQYPSPALLALNRLMERRVLAHADRVLATTPGHAAGLASLMPAARRARVRVIHNGYDPADLPAAVAPPAALFTLVHIGSFYGVRQPTNLLRALDRLVSSGALPAGDVRLVLAGSGAAPIMVPPALATVVELPGYLPHQEALRLLHSATVPVLVVGARGVAGLDNIPGKLYEYLATGKPILALADAHSYAAQLLRRARCGVVVPDESAAIAAALHTLYSQWRTGTPGVVPDWEEIRRFDRRRLTGELAAIFDEVTDAAGLHR
jgi:glycosyltransferase involved in cell wall biosynthesis